MLGFKLNLENKSLVYKVNGRCVHTHTDVEGPVHIAFSGNASSCAEIVEWWNFNWKLNKYIFIF